MPQPYHSDVAFETAVQCVLDGGVLVYPTETVYGVGGDARRPEVLARVRTLKGRDADKPVLVLTDGWARVKAWFGPVPAGARRLMEADPPPAVTLLLPATDAAPTGLVGPSGHVGIRRTADPFCRALVARTGAPLLSTSANPAGEPPPAHFEEIHPSILQAADCAVDARRPLAGVPSTIVRVSADALEVVREGAVSGEELHRILAG